MAVNVFYLVQMLCMGNDHAASYISFSSYQLVASAAG